MSRLKLDEYKTMPYSDRCRRIGDLLGLAAVRCFRQQRVAALARPRVAGRSAGLVDLTELVSDETEKKILEHLMLAGEATPKDFCAALHISPATVFRRLAHLRTVGLVRVVGKSRASRYRISRSERN